MKIIKHDFGLTIDIEVDATRSTRICREIDVRPRPRVTCCPGLAGVKVASRVVRARHG